MKWEGREWERKRREEEGGREERGRGEEHPLSDRSGYGPDIIMKTYGATMQCNAIVKHQTISDAQTVRLWP